VGMPQRALRRIRGEQIAMVFSGSDDLPRSPLPGGRAGS
jgi:hypothetical protein